MRVLIACEESQRVCIAFRALGHEAYSCDIIPCSGGHPEWHIHADVLPLINGNCVFATMDGTVHRIEGRWDLLIAHPPCTYLTIAGAVRTFNHDGSIKDPERIRLGYEAAEFFMALYNADCPRIAVENPLPMKRFNLPRYSQIIHPYMFGDPWKKRTCLWLKNLPLLVADNIVEPIGLWIGSASRNTSPELLDKYKATGKRNQKERSKTFPGIARAFAQQWGTIEEVANAA